MQPPNHPCQSAEGTAGSLGRINTKRAPQATNVIDTIKIQKNLKGERIMAYNDLNVAMLAKKKLCLRLFLINTRSGAIKFALEVPPFS